MGKLFGTDGIRSVANNYPMTPEMAVKFGRAVVSVFGEDGNRPKIVIGKDTRISGNMLEFALVSGICSMGGDAYLTGILPTPGVALMVPSTGADAGIVVSASHNPFYDNGIKIFNKAGYKLSDETEVVIEKRVQDDTLVDQCKSIQKTGSVYTIEDAGIRYADFLKQTMPTAFSLEGLKIVLDCANGATYKIAPDLFRDLGAEVVALFVDPDGMNINDGCGSEHTEILCKKVIENRADIGLAFDGDGDRLIAVDENGNALTGDQILFIYAKFMKQNNLLKNNRVVSTVMSNMGLGVALKEMAIKHSITKVGDRYVMEQMVASGTVIGGEDSGHMIFLNHHTTGDGILTALRLIEAVVSQSKTLSEIAQNMTVFPQVTINVDVKSKPDLETLPVIMDEIKRVENHLGEEGRVLVRYSGTQPLCRVMVEGPTRKETDRLCRQIADVVKATLG
ncbi:phosphoglucosamine mutase [Thermodesulfobacteriota bacterium]